MRNIKITLAYDGNGFFGYELQPGKRSIRKELEKALIKLFKSPIKFLNASRTDAGVHALSQVISLEIEHPIPLPKIPAALNSLLPEDIKVSKAEEVKENFHARYSPKSKEYEYLIFNGDTLPPFFRKFVWQVKPRLNLRKMRKAARILRGKHDFSSFCASGSDDKNFVRNLSRISIRRKRINLWDGCKLEVVSCKFKGNGFLYKMVRNMVGTLAGVGLGKIQVAEVKKILQGKDRRLAGRTAPAHGLCLVKINY